MALGKIVNYLMWYGTPFLYIHVISIEERNKHIQGGIVGLIQFDTP